MFLFKVSIKVDLLLFAGDSILIAAQGLLILNNISIFDGVKLPEIVTRLSCRLIYDV